MELAKGTPEANLITLWNPSLELDGFFRLIPNQNCLELTLACRRPRQLPRLSHREVSGAPLRMEEAKKGAEGKEQELILEQGDLSVSSNSPREASAVSSWTSDPVAQSVSPFPTLSPVCPVADWGLGSC